MADEEILQQAEKAKELIENSNLGERIKNRLFGSIGLLKNASTKGALNQMVQEKLLNKAMVSEWKKLRNKSVHPDKMNQGPIVFQKYINQINTCLALFYRLVFIIIKYEGSYIDYSERGWPEKKFKLKNE